MKVTDNTRSGLAARRQHRDLTKRGYRRHETDWEIVRGYKCDQRILDVKISIDGKNVYTLVGTP